MKISFIGSGNVATHLATSLNKISGVSILQIISKNKSHARHLAMKVKADAANELSRLKTNFDILIFAVNDDALEEILPAMELPNNKILCHTAGSISSTIFQKYSRHYGVIYPLQTFSKNKEIDWRDIPILLTASDDHTEKRLSHLAKQLSKKIQVITDEQRFALHVAAIFACNFSNATMTISQLLCHEKDLDFSLLHPLLAETMEKALRNGPKHSQTGPAKRGDRTVIEKHVKFLEEKEKEKEIYKLLTEYISDIHLKEN